MFTKEQNLISALRLESDRLHILEASESTLEAKNELSSWNGVQIINLRKANRLAALTIESPSAQRNRAKTPASFVDTRKINKRENSLEVGCNRNAGWISVEKDLGNAHVCMTPKLKSLMFVTNKEKRKKMNQMFLRAGKRSELTNVMIIQSMSHHEKLNTPKLVSTRAMKTKVCLGLTNRLKDLEIMLLKRLKQ
jgi:hypothetical protein